MGLFDQIIGALNNPNQAGSSDQLGSILNTAQQLSQNYGVSPQASQAVMSMVGSQVRSALQQKRSQVGDDSVQNMVNQFGGTSPNAQAVQMLFSPQQQQNLIQMISQHTGINSGTIAAILPMAVPLILNLLKTGNSTRHPQSPASNSVLNSFLDADRDGDVDVADAMRLAGQYLQR